MESRVDNATIGKVYRVMRTVGELCTDRGYVVPEEWFPKTIDGFRQIHLGGAGDSISYDTMALVCRLRTPEDSPPEDETMFVFFNGEDTVTGQRINDYRRKCQDEGVRRMLVIYAGKLIPHAKKVADEAQTQLKIQFFHEDDLVVNITHHELVPKHIPLSDREAKEMLKSHALQLSQLPRILLGDPVVQYFGLSRGRVVRIQRISETAGEYTTYRQVI